MATIQTTLNITSTDATSETLAIAQTIATTVTDPVQNTSTAIVDNAVATVLISGAKAVVSYVYIKNTDATNNIDLREAVTSVAFATLGPSEWAYLPIKAGVGLEVIASALTVRIEYGLWTQ